MTKDKELHILLKQLLDVDITFIIDDIVGNFTDPDIPVNVDSHNFSIDVDTPYGVCNITITDASGHYEVIFKKTIFETFYEEYCLNLDSNSKNFLVLYGQTTELREKGFIVNNIKKRYDSESNDLLQEKIYEDGKLKVNSISRVFKDQSVYLNKELKKLNRKRFFKKETPEQIFSKIGSVKNGLNQYPIYPFYSNTVSMSLPHNHWFLSSFIDVKIYDKDVSSYYKMCTGPNLVGRAYDLYQGIITNENYYDALIAIESHVFPICFAYEDCKNMGGKSTNEIIEEIAGNSTINDKKEYSKEVINIVDNYCNYNCNKSKSNSKKHKENNYIKQILLSNPNINDFKRGNNND